MTPQQEADNLLQQFYGVVDREIDSGQLVPKQCALICVERILELRFPVYFIEETIDILCEPDNSREYWEEVKKILQNAQ